MKTPHKHADLIKLWADGAEIQAEFGGPGPWLVCPHPQWNEDVNYRVKLEPVPNVVTWHRVYSNGEIPAGLKSRIDLCAAISILRIEINHTDPDNPRAGVGHTGKAMTTKQIFSEELLYESANILKSDDGENAEYDRALVELIAYVTGKDLIRVASEMGIKLEKP